MEFLQRVFNKIDINREEMIRTLSELIKIPSVAKEGAATEAPFGEAVNRAYTMMLDKAKHDGFDIFDASGYGGHIDYDGSNMGIVGIVGHLDVVPEGEGWDFAPYGGEIIDGYICGRGSTDDKGPVIASYFAMRALKEAGFQPAKTVRLILGLDEETNWHGMQEYLKRVGDVPQAGFTPDGDFPVIRAEMGILVFDILKKFPVGAGKGLELSSIKGGTAANAVPDFARAVIRDSAGGNYDSIKAMIAEYRNSSGFRINCKGIGKSLEMSVNGKSAHGARPQEGLNAISILMDFLDKLNFVNDGVSDFISFYNKHIGYDLNGEKIGCGLEDEDSGKLIFNVGKIELDKNTAKLTINVRYPVSTNDEQVYAGLTEVLEKYGLGIVKGKKQDPISLDADSELVRNLMDVYRDHTGDIESEPMVIGGGTYARALDNIVAFGARFPGEPELCHQKNEKISIDNLLKLTRIYADAIYRLSKEAD